VGRDTPHSREESFLERRKAIWTIKNIVILHILALRAS
jgi:hypothetical protein